MKLKKLTTIFLAVLCAMLLITPVFAAGDVIIDYNGACNPGGIQGSGGTVSSGYLIPSVGNNIDLIYGFRFSIYDGDGNKKTSREGTLTVDSLTVDVFVKTPSSNYKGGIIATNDAGVRSKKEWDLNSGVRVVKASGMGNIRKEVSLAGLPSGTNITAAKLQEWIASEQNQKALYEACGLEYASLKATDFILVEPLVAIKINNNGLLVTPTDLAVLCAYEYGTDFNGRGVTLHEGTLGYLAGEVNKTFPAFLTAPDTMMGITGSQYIATVGGYIKNGDIISSGYGCNIVSLSKFAPTEHTNTITHYAWVNGKWESFGTTTFKAAVGSSFTMGADRAIGKAGYHLFMDCFGYRSVDGTWKSPAIGSTVMQEDADMGFEYYYYPNEHKNTIAHWAWGFKNKENICSNGAKSAVDLGNTTFTEAVGDSFTLDTDRVTRIPNGFYLVSTFGSSSIDGVWNSYPMGTSVTQKDTAMSFEYDYMPYEYKITYDLNGGVNSADNPATYTILYSVYFSEPTRAGYDFLGWYNDAGEKVLGINHREAESDVYPYWNANFRSVDDMYAKLEQRSTGDVTLHARWVKLDLNVEQYGYDKYNNENIEGVPEGSTLTKELNKIIADGKIYSGLNTKTTATGKTEGENNPNTNYIFNLVRGANLLKTTPIKIGETKTLTDDTWRPKTEDMYAISEKAEIRITDSPLIPATEQKGFYVIWSNLACSVKATTTSSGANKCGDCITVEYTFRNTFFDMALIPSYNASDVPTKVFARISYTSDINGNTTEQYILLENNEPKTISLTFHDVIPATDKLTFRASIYMGDMFDTKDASYETNREDNEAEKVLDFKSALTAKFIEPNTTYRRGKTVVAAYDITNNSVYGLYAADKRNQLELGTFGNLVSNDRYSIDYFRKQVSEGSDDYGQCSAGDGTLKKYGESYPYGRRFAGNITPTLKVFDKSGNLLATLTIADTSATYFECPVGGTGRVWFSYTVPEYYRDDEVRLVMTCDPEHILVGAGFDNADGQVCENTVLVTDEYVVQTPDTCYASQSPRWFFKSNYERFLERNKDTINTFSTENGASAALKQYWKGLYENNGSAVETAASWIRYVFDPTPSIDMTYTDEGGVIHSGTTRVGSFVKYEETYTANNSGGTTASIGLLNTKYESVDGGYAIKSGYGYELFAGYKGQVRRGKTVLLKGTHAGFSTVPVESMGLDNSQSAYAFFPEFMYMATTSELKNIYDHNAIWYIQKWGSEVKDHTGFKQPNVYDGHFEADTVNNGEYGTFAALDRTTGSDARWYDWQLPINTSTGNRMHYTPIWMPDGAYAVVTCFTDIWTPAGMLTDFASSADTAGPQFFIKGNMYQDYVFASWTQIRHAGEDEPIPTGCEYLTRNNSYPDGYKHYKAGDEYPRLNEGDKLMTPDYEYTYATGAGWSVTVRDTTKNSYSAILGKINGAEVTSLSGTFEGCANMVSAPAIPETVTVIDRAYMGCSSLLVAPDIPDSVISVQYAFADCTSLTSLRHISKNIEYIQSAFENCKDLTGTFTFSGNKLLGYSDTKRAFDGTEKAITIVNRDGAWDENGFYYVAGGNWDLNGGNVHVVGADGSSIN